MYNGNNLKVELSAENNMAKAFVIATGGTIDQNMMNWLYGLYDADRSYGQVLTTINEYMNGRLASNNGDLVKTFGELVTNITGQVKTNQELQLIIDDYVNNKNIKSWGDLYTHWVVNSSDSISQTLSTVVVDKIASLLPVDIPKDPLYDQFPFLNQPTKDSAPGADAQLPMDFFAVSDAANNLKYTNLNDTVYAVEFGGSMKFTVFNKTEGYYGTEVASPLMHISQYNDLVFDFSGGDKHLVMTDMELSRWLSYDVYFANFSVGDEFTVLVDSSASGWMTPNDSLLYTVKTYVDNDGYTPLQIAERVPYAYIGTSGLDAWGTYTEGFGTIAPGAAYQFHTYAYDLQYNFFPRINVTVIGQNSGDIVAFNDSNFHVVDWVYPI